MSTSGTSSSFNGWYCQSCQQWISHSVGFHNCQGNTLTPAAVTWQMPAQSREAEIIAELGQIRRLLETLVDKLNKPL